MERRKNIEGKSLFYEVQKISPWFAVALLFSGAGVGIVLLIREIFYTRSVVVGAQVLLILLVLLVLGLAISLMFARMTLLVTEEGLFIRYYPFQRRFVFISRTEITACYVRSFDAFSEYGGVGIKGRRKNLGYSVLNSKGLQLELQDGTRILIGTEQPEVLSTVMQTYLEDQKM